jgi:hypothetical protein
MPRFDGTGPRGEGPFTGRGEGYCAVRLPEEGSAARGEPIVGFAGLQGRAVCLEAPPGAPGRWQPFPRPWPRPGAMWGPAPRPWRGRRGRHGRRSSRRF